MFEMLSFPSLRLTALGPTTIARTMVSSSSIAMGAVIGHTFQALFRPFNLLRLCHRPLHSTPLVATHSKTDDIQASVRLLNGVFFEWPIVAR